LIKKIALGNLSTFFASLVFIEFEHQHYGPRTNTNQSVMGVGRRPSFMTKRPREEYIYRYIDI